MSERQPKTPLSTGEKRGVRIVSPHEITGWLRQLPALKLGLHRQKLRVARLESSPGADAARLAELRDDVKDLEREIEGWEDVFDMQEERGVIETLVAIERAPTVEKVRTFLERFIRGESFEEELRREDGEGLYLWDIKLSTPDIEGCTVGYSYMRAGRYPEGETSETAIHMTHYNREGFPLGGQSVAKYRNGRWVLTP
ncbi:MAG: hypothetical protein WC030_02325 [Candidatus Paceibacterota bacterium]